MTTAFVREATTRPVITRAALLALLIVAGVSCHQATSPTGLPEPAREAMEAVSGSFFDPSVDRHWTHSRYYDIRQGGTLSARITFLGDYNDLLWTEVWEGEARLGQVIARGYFWPKQRLDVPVQPGHRYEVRIWTDKCCTRYEGFVVRPQ